MSPQVPNPGVYYRIQNVDFATFLGVADMSLFKPRLVLRPLKEDDKSQQVSVLKVWLLDAISVVS